MLSWKSMWTLSDNTYPISHTQTHQNTTKYLNYVCGIKTERTLSPSHKHININAFNILSGKVKCWREIAPLKLSENIMRQNCLRIQGHILLQMTVWLCSRLAGNGKQLHIGILFLAAGLGLFLRSRSIKWWILILHQICSIHSLKISVMRMKHWYKTRIRSLSDNTTTQSKGDKKRAQSLI